MAIREGPSKAQGPGESLSTVLCQKLHFFWASQGERGLQVSFQLHFFPMFQNLPLYWVAKQVSPSTDQWKGKGRPLPGVRR